MRPTHARGKQSGRSLVEAKADCVTERDTPVMLGYVITNRKSVTFRNTRSNAGVFSLALFLLNKLSLHRMASASHIHNPASVPGVITLKLEQKAAISHFTQGNHAFVALYWLRIPPALFSLLHWYSTGSGQ